MNQDFKIMNMFSRIVDLLFLNFLFVVTSIPLITIGASFTALYSVNLKMVRGEESYIARDFFHAFKKNFLPATFSFLFFVLSVALLCSNILISYRTPTSFYIVLRSLSFVFLCFIWVCFLYFFPILARFRFTLRQICIHIPHMLITHLAEFALLIIINIPILFLCFYSVYTAVFTFVIGCLFGFAAITYVQALLFRRIFEPYELA